MCESVDVPLRYDLTDTAGVLENKVLSMFHGGVRLPVVKHECYAKLSVITYLKFGNVLMIVLKFELQDMLA